MTQQRKPRVDYPFYEVVKTAKELINEGATIYQKFTCCKCGSRQGMDVPNTFFKKGKCEECGWETNLIIAGCNYMVVRDIRRKGSETRFHGV